MHAHLTAWWNGVSLRTKITGVTVMLLTLGLLVSGVGTMSMLRTYLVQEVDTRTVRVASALQSAVYNAITIEDGACLRISSGIGEESYLGLVAADGTVLCDNRADDAPAPDIADLSLAEVREADGRAFSVGDVGGGSPWRVVAEARFFDGLPGLHTLVVGGSLASVNGVIARFGAIFMFFALAVVVLGGVMTRLLVVSTFAPLREVEETAARFADGDFSQRMGGTLPNTEVGRLNRSLNAMLARIDSAFADRARTIAQMRRFVGDASHELRTPLVSVRGYAELYRMGALASDQDVRQAMDRIEKEAVRMSELVSDLLELARLDETKPLMLREIDLLPIAHDAAMDTRASAPDRPVTVVPLTLDDDQPDAEPRTEAVEAEEPEGAFGRATAGSRLARLRGLRKGTRKAIDGETESDGASGPLHAVVLGEENKVRQVVTNLLGNAQRFSPLGSPIEIGVGVDATRRMGVVAIIDHGRGIPPQQRDKIFQRFWRADTSRTRETGGTGLGLAIVSAIVTAHGGLIEVDETPGGGATFRVLLPLAPSAARSPED